MRRETGRGRGAPGRGGEREGRREVGPREAWVLEEVREQGAHPE